MFSNRFFLNRSEKNYKFHMLIDDFGYEDLLYDLAQKGIRICLDLQRSEIFQRQQILDLFTNNFDDADIIVLNQLPDNFLKYAIFTFHVDFETSFLSHHLIIDFICLIFRLYNDMKVITIKCSIESDAASSDGLRIIQYSIHPTMPDIHYIVHLTAPLHIYTIEESKSLPFNLNHLCRYDDTYDKENQHNLHGVNHGGR